MATTPTFTRPEQRSAERAPLAVLRAAKLVTQAGEYVCMVRDVSTGGVRIQMFHAVPADDHAFLELGNGEVYPMIRVWTRDRQAGFRFPTPIDVAAFIAEAGKYPRRAIRLRIRRPGLAYSGGIVRNITLRDLSQTGASFSCRDYLALFQPLVLSIDGLPECSGWVRWRQGQDYGMVFEATCRLDQLAAQALVLQPLGDDKPQAGQALTA